MNSLKSGHAFVRVVLAVVCLQMLVLGQTADDKNNVATVTASGLTIKWEVSVSNAGVSVTISAPDEQVYRKDFKTGSAEFTLTDAKGERLPDGQYTYELRVVPVISSEVKEALAKARAKGDDAEVRREFIKRGQLPSRSLVASGSFSIANGSVVLGGATEEGSRRVARAVSKPRPFRPNPATAMSGFKSHHATVNPFFDFVIADDLIVQGSICAGLDCVDGESFGFDTIRVKENNTRIQFDDTSSSAGFASNNWQIRANSSASGGGNFLAFVDQGTTGNSETGTIVFEVDAGAPANSLRVASNGKVGLRTATPVLDVHANTTDTPAVRLEQNNSGGFTAQTWDVAGNEANFFVRDVTSGSRLPFRIRPGAPTSSIDIAASGFVGIGTGSPATFGSGTLTGGNFVHLTSATTTGMAISGTLPEIFMLDSDGTANNRVFQLVQDAGLAKIRVVNDALNNLTLDNVQVWNMTTGNVGIGTAAPTDLLSVNGSASKPGGGSWSVFSDERLKNIKGSYNRGLNALMQLQPLRYEYKPNNALGLKSPGEHVGFAAQSVQQIIPEAVSRTDNGYLTVNNDPIIWTMLNAIKEQQKEIEQLKAEVRRLRATPRRRR